MPIEVSTLAAVLICILWIIVWGVIVAALLKWNNPDRRPAWLQKETRTISYYNPLTGDIVWIPTEPWYAQQVVEVSLDDLDTMSDEDYDKLMHDVFSRGARIDWLKRDGSPILSESDPESLQPYRSLHLDVL